MTKQQKPSQGIAIVGLSCWYPGAQSLVEFWENILAKRQQFRRMPDEQLPLDQYQDSNRATPDKTYGTEAAVLDGFEFDWKSRRIPKQVFESTDIVHWLALEVALKALDDSGLDLAKLQSQQTGVILGNTLTGEWTRTNAMRMRWPFFERVLRETAANKGMLGEGLDSYISSVEEAFKSVFPTINEDTLAGALSNTIAGRICNFLDLHGGGYTVDGACSSSLIAIITAARNLANHDLDVAFAGGIDISLDTFELIGFAKTGALTPDEMRVYDKRANGFIPGEGCGFVVMKRLEDAQRDGDRIYAVLKGWGLSSDGKGGMTAPSISGQAHAIGKAYAMAGFGLEMCDFIEGHGTGTTVGDKVEISALVEVLGDKKAARGIGLTSLKSIVGHTKAAAGIGAFIKTTIALNQRVMPPMAGVEDPNLLFQDKARAFYPIMQGKKYSADTVMRAGVSAMGFGGINSHTALESYGEPASHLLPGMDENLLFVSHDKAEVLVFSANSQTSLQKKLQQTLSHVRLISRAELGDLAADLSRFVSGHEPFRAAVVASKPEDAWQALLKLKSWLDSPMALQQSRDSIEGSTFISLGHSTKAPRLGFLFPGQGAQKLNMGKKLVQRYEWAQTKAEEAHAITQEQSEIDLLIHLFAEAGLALDEATQKLTLTERAQPAISLTNALWLEYLQRLGLNAHAVGGHSLGELSALYAAKSFSFSTLIKLAAKRGQLMAQREGQAGAMIHLACDAETASNLMKNVLGYCT
ncbi:MAG: beta-ketoacyl synthase N-terminal-like domain-containing protein, partial [Proteobacteria bacterium]|nr:beta-ketoacyl synthase N-terminal-like domain-containing protein [Pseudomonadota bacterium]